MNESLFAALSCIQLIIIVVGLLLIVNRNRVLDFEDKIRLAYHTIFKKERDAKQVVRVVDDFYGRAK